MRFFDRILVKFFDDDDSTGLGGVNERELLENAGEKAEKEDEKTEEKDEQESEEGDREKEEEESLSLGEDNEESKEDEEETGEVQEEFVQRLKKIDKDVFKKIPELRSVIFREAEYTQVYPTVQEAKDSVEALDTFNNLQNDLINGDLETVFQAVENTGKENMQNFASNFLPTLEKQNKDLYHNILAPHFKKFLRLAAKSHNEDIRVSAENVNHFLFNDGDVNKDAGFEPIKKSDKEDALTKREKEFEQRQYMTFASDLNTTARGQANRTIKMAFANSGMSELIQNQLAREIFDRVDEQLRKDNRHLGNMNALWRRAQSEGYTTDGKNRLLRAYLSRAKVLIPKVRAQVLSEAKVSGNTKSNEGRLPTRIPSGNAGSLGSNKIDPKKIDWNKTSERDLLDGKATMKK